ncbi:sensor histidine kinase [Gorillibacterium sp. sgz5001074]|uniref:sensor histidine kinase n=1 Tax=Gorillibacterium sp. sgz5001074 TaxID=3446695 RepID=UPI003F67D98C
MKPKLSLLRRTFPFNWFGDMYGFCGKLALMARVSVVRSIRLQLMFTFMVCLVASTFIYAVGNVFFGELNRSPILDYQYGIETIDGQARQIANYIKTPDVSYQGITDYITRNVSFTGNKVLLADLDGKVFFKAGNATETQVDLHDIIANAMEARYSPMSKAQEFTSFYPVELKDQPAYLIVTGIPQPSITYQRGSSPLTLMTAIASFIFIFYWMTKRKMAYVEELARGLAEISKGHFHFRVAQRSKDELGSLAASINKMAEALQKTIDEERKAERTKNELITNVSHDLRTPLTLIMGYLRLLKDKHYEDSKQADNYLQIAYGKSEKLKALIDDLFEYTKLSNQIIHMNPERVCLNELLEQLSEELVTYAEENGLHLEREITGERMVLSMDAHKIIRVFENLLGNAVKYSHSPGTIRVRLIREEPGWALVTISNRGEPIPQEELPRLFDRFYRVDASRTSSSGGSGLGLAIAKSIVEAHKGEIWAECEGEDIRFCVKLPL